MQITLDLPEDIARQLGSDPGGLQRTALEALTLEGVRAGKLSAGQARRLLGLATRLQTDAFLKDHGVYLPLTVDSVEEDAEVSRSFREQWSSSPTPPHSTTSS
jgi:hypothetical protein